MASRTKSLTKGALMKAIKSLPERFDADEVIERIILLQKVEEGLADAKNGRVHSLEEMRAYIQRRWS